MLMTDDELRELVAHFTDSRDSARYLGRDEPDRDAITMVIRMLLPDANISDAVVEEAMLARKGVWSALRNRGGARNLSDIEIDAMRAVATVIYAMQFSGLV